MRDGLAPAYLAGFVKTHAFYYWTDRHTDRQTNRHTYSSNAYWPCTDIDRSSRTNLVYNFCKCTLKVRGSIGLFPWHLRQIYFIIAGKIVWKDFFPSLLWLWALFTEVWHRKKAHWYFERGDKFSKQCIRGRKGEKEYLILDNATKYIWPKVINCPVLLLLPPPTRKKNFLCRIFVLAGKMYPVKKKVKFLLES